LSHFYDSLQHGLVAAGDIGELVEQFIYILARDNCLTTADTVELTYPTFKLKAFLNSLSANSVSKLQADCGNCEATKYAFERLMDADMSFSHFNRKFYTPDRSDILVSYLRSEAVVCMDGQKGIDLIIPLRLPAGAECLTRPLSPSVTSADYHQSPAEDPPGKKRKGSSAPVVEEEATATMRPGGIRSFNDAQFLADPSVLERRGGPLIRKIKLDKSSPTVTAQLLQAARLATDPESMIADYEELLSRTSFILVQVKNKIREEKNDAHSVDPFVSGILPKKSPCPPYLALLHEMRRPKSSPELMPPKMNRFGLTIGEATHESSPCLNFNRHEKEDVAQAINSLITATVEPLSVTRKLNDRLPLAFGAHVNSFKLSEKLFNSELAFTGDKD
jgi:hypothetical protein